MPLVSSEKVARSIQRRTRRAAEEVRNQWTGRERRQRRLQAFRMQGKLATIFESELAAAEG